MIDPQHCNNAEIFKTQKSEREKVVKQFNIYNFGNFYIYMYVIDTYLFKLELSNYLALTF